MFEREIQYISDFTLNSIKKLGTFFTLGSLSTAKIHPAILQYISAELDYLIYLDRQELLKHSLFDYSGPEILKHFNAIAAEIKKNKLIPFEDARRVVQQAVTFNVNFLLRPRWSLKQFIYDAEDNRTAEELKLLLNYSYFFDYYKVFLTRYIERKGITSLSASEFADKTNIITHELLTTQFEGIISNSLEDAAVFLNMGDTNKTRLSVETIEVYLRDRKLEHLIAKIRNQLSPDPKQKFDIDDYRQIILGNDRQIDMADFESSAEFDDSKPAPPQDAAEPSPLTEDTVSIDIDKFFEEIPNEETANLKPAGLISAEPHRAPAGAAEPEPDAEAANIAAQEQPGDIDMTLPSQIYTEPIEPAPSEEIREFSPDAEAEAFTQLLTEQLSLADGPQDKNELTDINSAQLPDPDSLHLRILEEIRAANEISGSDDIEPLPPPNNDVPPIHLNQAVINSTDMNDEEKSQFDEEILSISLPAFETQPNYHETVIPPASEESGFGDHYADNNEIDEFDYLENSDTDELIGIGHDDNDEFSNVDSDTGDELGEVDSDVNNEFGNVDIEEDDAGYEDEDSGFSDVIDSELESLLSDSEDEPEEEVNDEEIFNVSDSEEESLTDNDEFTDNLEEQSDASDEFTPQSEEINFVSAEPQDTSGTLDEDLSEETQTELFNYFTTKETMRIVSVVFKNDSIDFVSTIERIATCPNFEEAALILKSVFFAYHIDPISDKEAKLLEDRIREFFER